MQRYSENDQRSREETKQVLIKIRRQRKLQWDFFFYRAIAIAVLTLIIFRDSMTNTSLLFCITFFSLIFGASYMLFLVEDRRPQKQLLQMAYENIADDKIIAEIIQLSSRANKSKIEQWLSLTDTNGKLL